VKLWLIYVNTAAGYEDDFEDARLVFAETADEARKCLYDLYYYSNKSFRNDNEQYEDWLKYDCTSVDEFRIPNAEDVRKATVVL